MNHCKLAASCVALLGIASSTLTHSAGFQLFENSASGQGNSYAGSAAIAEDASTVWFNPAGMTRLDKNETLFAGHWIEPGSRFTNNGSTTAGGAGALNGANDDGGSTALVGNFYHVTELDERMKLGIGITTPFGLATVYNDNWVGRYHAVESDLRTLNFNPSIAYRVDDRLSVGGGINIMLADVVLTSAIDFGALLGAPQTADGFADLEGDNLGDLGYGFNFGILYEIADGTRLGIAWRSEIDLEVEGDAVFSVPAAAAPVLASGGFQNSALTAEVTLPQLLSLSLAHEMDKMTLLCDVTWTGWSSFQELRIRYANPNQPDSFTTEGWEDTLRIAVGVDYRYDERTTLRAGFAWDESPVPNAARRTPRVPDTDRRWLSFGATYVLDDAMTIDIGYSHLFISDAVTSNTIETDSPTTAGLRATLNGTYEATVDILSVQLRWYH